MTTPRSRPDPKTQRNWSLLGTAGGALVFLSFGLFFAFTTYRSISLVAMIIGGLLTLLNVAFALRAHRVLRRDRD